MTYDYFVFWVNFQIAPYILIFLQTYFVILKNYTTALQNLFLFQFSPFYIIMTNSVKIYLVTLFYKMKINFQK